MGLNVNESGLTTNGASPIQAENLSIEVTTRCTNDCWHCFARAGKQASADLTLNDAISAVDEAYDMGYRHLHLTGGDPLLWHHLFDLLDHTTEKVY